MSDKAKRVALYCRVSTSDQTTENQKRDLTRFCESRGWHIVRVFEDTGISGAQESRPQLNELMAQARQCRFDAVMVWKFDRFARSTQHLLQALQEFKPLGIDFVSYSEGIDTSTPMGKMTFTFLGAIAEFERELIRERTKAGVARARAEGAKLGRPRVAFDVQKAVELRNTGLGFKQVARALGIPRTTLFRAIRGIPQTCVASNG